MSDITADTVLPGQPLAKTTPGPVLKTGRGVYTRDSQLRASIFGRPCLNGTPVTTAEVASRIQSSPTNSNAGGLTVENSQKRHAQPPQTNSVVLGSVTRLSPTMATIAISVVDGVPLPQGEEFAGVIRVQDVRATEKDKVKLAECFRGGDVVKGLVISLGDARSYYVTTARNDLGVIFASSQAGATMEPISWQEMRCPKTNRIEKRKCAKPEGL